jgi:hypothetical protein
MTTAVLSLLLSLAATPAQARPLVAVRAAPAPKVLSDSEWTAREKELDARYTALLRAHQELSDDLRTRYGKKEKEWPEESRRALRLAAERAASVDGERRFLRWDAAYADSVADINEVLAKSKRLQPAASPKEADLVIEVLNRKTFPPRHHVLCRIVLGDRVGKKQGEALAWQPGMWPEQQPHEAMPTMAVIEALHSWQKEEPWWILHLSAVGTWKELAWTVVYSLEKFLKDHGQPLTGATGGK